MVIAKYELIYRELRDQILSERYLDGKLPPLQKLSSAYRVNPATISKAVKQLESEGLVQCGPGSTGTIINLEQVRILQRKQIFSRSNFHQKSVHLRYCLPASGDILYAKLVEDFQSLYPSIEIELAECTESEIMDIGCRDADVFQFALRNYPLLRKHGSILELAPFMERLPIESTLIDSGIVDHTAVPFFVNTPMVLINNDLCGPDFEGNWDELQALVYAGKLVLNLGPLPFFYAWIGDLQENFCKIENRERLTKAFALLKDMQNCGIEVGGCRIPDDFLQGNVAVYIASSTYLGELDGKLPFGYRTLLLPHFGNEGTLSEAGFNAVFSGSRYPVESYLWCRYLGSSRAQRLLGKRKFAVPVCAAAFEQYRNLIAGDFTADDIFKSPLTYRMSFFTMADFEYFNAMLIKRSIAENIAGDVVVAKMQQHFAEYSSLDDLR